MKTSVIVTTYNRPDALAAVLEGLLCQSDRDFEVIVADDGSTSETEITVGRFQERGLLPLRHVWQDDQGFRVQRLETRRVRFVESYQAPTLVYRVFKIVGEVLNPPARWTQNGHDMLAYLRKV